MKSTQPAVMAILPSRHSRDRPRVVPTESADDIGGSALTTVLLVAAGGLIVLALIALTTMKGPTPARGFKGGGCHGDY
jgi:hypothetical protein